MMFSLAAKRAAAFGAVRLPSGAVLDYSRAPLVMGIVNCTEDSFYAVSRASTVSAAVERALAAEADGAALVDFGAESTRPGAAYVDAEEESRRLLPVIEAFRRRSALPVSVDTRKARVARAALDAGADIINDISALEDDPDMAACCAALGAPVILTHKRGVPQTMQQCPAYADVVDEVAAYLADRALLAEKAGIAHVILDPGIGFGKRLEDNLALIRRFDRIAALGRPALMALSRKSFLGELTGRSPDGRLAGTLAASALALLLGAALLRVHDVPETRDLVIVLQSLCQ